MTNYQDYDEFLSEMPPNARSQIRAGVKLYSLYRKADYHGLDSSGNDCTCKWLTHERRVYPQLMKELEKLENHIAHLKGTYQRR